MPLDERLLSAFLKATSGALRPRRVQLIAPPLPVDLREFLERFEGGEMFWIQDKFRFFNNPFRYNLNIFVAFHDILPMKGVVEAFRGYDQCFVLAAFNPEPEPGDDDIPNLYLGVDLSQENFGWMLLYSGGEHPWYLSNAATYVADSWSGFMSSVIEERYEFRGDRFWSFQNRVLSDADLAHKYTPSLPLSEGEGSGDQ